MNPRLVVAVALVTACAITAAGIALAPRGQSAASVGQSAESAPRGGFAGALRPPGMPPADFALRDQDGERVAAAGLRGDVSVVTFLYTTCEDSCPLIAQQIRGALDLLERDVPVVAVSVDPVDDTPQRARAFLLDQGLAGRMDFLLGSREELRPVWEAYGIRPRGVRERGADLDHSISVVLLDAAGLQRIGFPGDQLTPERLAADVGRLRAATARGS